MNVREFREEVADAFLRGIDWSLQAPASDAEIARTPGGVPTIMMQAANRHATSRVIANAAKLEPMP